MAACYGLRLPAGSTVRRYAEPALVSAAFSVVYLVLHPLTGDHAAQQFRTVLFQREGFAAWDNLWFGGHHLPGYSILFPPLAAEVGPRMLGVLSCFAASLLFAGIAGRRWGRAARLGIVWFAAGASISLFTGRLTFALGVPIGLAAVLCSQAGYRKSAIAFAALCALASPVAALFLGFGGIAYSVAERRRAGLELAAAAIATTVAVALAFPEGGDQPFSFSTLYPALIATALVLLPLPRKERMLRVGVAAYGLALAAAYVIATPMGSNAPRMGALLLGPLLACALWSRRRFALVVIAPVIVFWQVYPVIGMLGRVQADTSTASYYAPVRDYLRGATRHEQYRVEVVPEVDHWESTYVPRGIYIARGWERQLDRELNPLFYQDRLGAGEYRHWLDDLAVGFVAVPHAPLDSAGEAEAKLIKRGLPYLRLVYRTRNWRVYRVLNPTPLATGAAHLVKLSVEGVVLKANAPGTALVRVRWTPYWAVTDGAGCVEESPGGFTQVSIDRPGTLKLGVRYAPWRLLSGGPSCSHDDSAAG